MNGLESRYRTLGQLMTELRSRLGFIAYGSASKTNDLLIKSFLQEAHDYVFGELEPTVMRKKTIIKLQPGSYRYDWHNDEEDEVITPGNVISVWLHEPISKLTQGISEAERAYVDLQGCPQKYDTLNGQMELFPCPDREYDLVVEYIANHSRFERADDRPSVPDRLVFLYALATAKAHYRHADAQASAATFTNMLNKEKARQKENRRYFFKGQDEGSRPAQVVKTMNGYGLKL